MSVSRARSDPTGYRRLLLTPGFSALFRSSAGPFFFRPIVHLRSPSA
jgi:hypothetical protein